MQQLMRQIYGHVQHIADRFDKPVAFIASLTAIIVIPSLIWAFIASQLGIEPGQLLAVFVTAILPILIVYCFASGLLLRRAIKLSRQLPSYTGSTLIAVALACVFTIAYLGYHDLRARSRDRLVLQELAMVEKAACEGRYRDSLKVIERLKGSKRYAFLVPDLDRATNFVQDMLLIQSELPEDTDSAGVAERALLFGKPENLPASAQVSGSLWGFWLKSEAARCKRS